MVILINHPVPTEGIHHTEPNVTAYYQDKNLGKGTLYISESVLCWINSSGEGFSLEYLSIFIHAVSKDLSNFPQECLYLMIDGNINFGEAPQELSVALNNLSVDESDTEDDDYAPSAEMRFVPDNRNMLDVMFRALSDCQALNPDPNEDFDDDDAMIAPPFTVIEGNGFDSAEFENQGVNVENKEEAMDEEQFEDAEQ